MSPGSSGVKRLALVALLLVSAPASAQSAATAPAPSPAPGSDNGLGPLSGRLFAHVRVPTASLDAPLQQASTSVWIGAHPRFSDVASAKILLTADALYSSVTPNTTLRAAVREGYVQGASHGWDVRVGQQILPWGNGDAVNPTDFLTAKDYTFFSADPEVRRLGALSLRTGWTPNGGDSPFELTVVVQPIYPSSKLLVPPDALPVGVTDLGLVRPTMNLGNVETAARAAYNGASWDAAIVAFRGFNHTPEFFLSSYSAATNAASIGETNQAETALGAQVSATLGTWVLRAEGAYVSTDDPTMSDPSHEPSHVDAVGGIERAFGERVRVQLQGIVRWHPTFRPVGVNATADPVLDAINLVIARTNATFLNYQDQTRPAASFRIAYASQEDTFEAELFVLANLRSDVDTTDYIVRPMLTYRPSDPFKLQVGAEIYGGPFDTPLGIARSFSGAFAEVGYAY